MAPNFKVGDHIVAPYGATGRVIKLGPVSADPGNQVVYILRDKPLNPGTRPTQTWAFAQSLVHVKE